MYNTWPNLPDLKVVRWPLGGGMEISQGGAAEGAQERGEERAWGSDRLGRENIDGEDQHRAGNQRVQRTDNREPITREREVETWRGLSYGVVQPDWNGVTRNNRTNAQGRG